ncbi:MBL fold metallo-hydrolase [Anaerofilum sp. BX8]|uniref:MBL fold metallo-hydrolase n=1 Tax=Anaerofilum hominis TaxID=2763016 RepID=A0A923IEX2_9FIRM|nr:MBL fold metallo-hydrolase [Anaerofilum hominis]MBC5582105.1 MBL fold metallo-hydrolase [Anaerofilum hominis]
MFHQFSRRVWYMDHDEASDRPVLGYVRGDRRCLMIDAGNSRRHAEEFLTQLERSRLPRPGLVALTHSHWDHCYGLHALDAVSISCTATLRDLERDAALSWSSDDLRRYGAEGIVPQFCEEHMRVEYPQLEEITVALPEITFEGTLQLDLGGCCAVLRQLVNPHAPDGVVVHLPEERTLFVGDAAYQELVGNDWVDHRDRLELFLRELEQMDFTHCFIGHGMPMPRSELFAWFGERLDEQPPSHI